MLLFSKICINNNFANVIIYRLENMGAVIKILIVSKPHQYLAGVFTAPMGEICAHCGC